jgi:hypothetical protein
MSEPMIGAIPVYCADCDAALYPGDRHECEPPRRDRSGLIALACLDGNCCGVALDESTDEFGPCTCPRDRHECEPPRPRRDDWSGLVWLCCVVLSVALVALAWAGAR